MAVPAVVSMSPSRGLSVGGELVRLVVRDAARQVGIWLGERPVLFSSREEHSESSIFWLRLPPLVVGEALLVVENLDEHGRPIPGERIEWRGYEAERSSLVAEGTIATITRALLRLLREHVTASVRYSVAVDFDSDVADGARLVPLAESPSLTLGGPTLEINRFYAPVAPVRRTVETLAGPRLVEESPGLTVDLVYEVTGSSQRAVELLNLMSVTALFLGRTRWLALPRDPVRPAAGELRWELDVDGGMRAAHAGADGIHVFTTQIRIRGVTLDHGNATGVVAPATEETQLELSLGGSEVEGG